jgi:hypothetical protein
MKIDPKEMQRLAETGVPRFDMYTGIHKAIRAQMADALLALGRMDADDEADLTQATRRVLDLLDMCTSHLQHENEFVHPALEARAPGTSAAIASEHVNHEWHIAQLTETTKTLLGAVPANRAQVAALLYRELTLFLADNFQHMHQEETAHNQVLWANYTDAELIGIHQTLVAAIAPDAMVRTMRWMVPAMSPAERTAMLADMLAHAPRPAFDAVMETARPHLNESEWANLTRSLNLPAVPGLVTA